MKTWLRNTFMNSGRYKEHSEAVIIACYFNPQESPYRRKAFDKFYHSIKHLNHLILECVIGNAKPELHMYDDKNIQVVHTENLLWHKESLLNLAVQKLPSKYKYVFWVDADVTFTNLNWLRDSVAEFKAGANIIQPFEYCVHLEKDAIKPPFDVDMWALNKAYTKPGMKRMWRSFCANCVNDETAANSKDYDTHGHVGFAWGAKREVLEKVPLYDKALIGGADHIIAHAAAGHIPCSCMNKSFTEDLDNVYDWSKEFYAVVQGKIAYTKGNLFHTWHGDIEKRQYLKRIQEFTPETKEITEKDANGLYVTKKGDSPYIKKYFDHREVKAKPSLPIIEAPAPKTKIVEHHYHNSEPYYGRQPNYHHTTSNNAGHYYDNSGVANNASENFS